LLAALVVTHDVKRVPSVASRGTVMEAGMVTVTVPLVPLQEKV
jgi:energy-coupling factor transporter ATP-binding protein EcfA2